MKVSGRLEHEISHFKNPSLRVLTTSFPPTTERPLTPHTPGRKCPRTREDSRMRARRVRQTHASRIFPYTTLNRKVHVFESRFHKTFTRKKHFTKYHSPDQSSFPTGPVRLPAVKIPEWQTKGAGLLLTRPHAAKPTRSRLL